MKFDDFFSDESLLIFNALALLVLTVLHLLFEYSWVIYAVAAFAVFAIEGLVFSYHFLRDENRRIVRYLGATALFITLFTTVIFGYADSGLVKSMLGGFLSPGNFTLAAIASGATNLTTTTESALNQTALTTQNTDMPENPATTSISTTAILPSTTITISSVSTSVTTAPTTIPPPTSLSTTIPTISTYPTSLTTIPLSSVSTSTTTALTTSVHTTSSTSVPTTSTSTRSSTTSKSTTTSTTTKLSTTSSTTTSRSTTSSSTTSSVVTTTSSDTLYFSGRYWYIVKSPQTWGGNYFYYNGNSDYVDGNGYLHMSLFNVNNRRYASEINTSESLGYGKYTFLILGDISHLDKNAVLGLFTWDDNSNTTPGNKYNREIDIEMSRWGAQNGTNAEIGVQPEPPSAVRDYNITYTGDILASMTWKPGEVDFSIKQSPSNVIIEQWNYTGSLVPTPGFEKTHINLWAYYAPTSSNVTVVIKSFSFTKV